MGKRKGRAVSSKFAEGVLTRPYERVVNRLAELVIDQASGFKSPYRELVLGKVAARLTVACPRSRGPDVEDSAEDAS